MAEAQPGDGGPQIARAKVIRAVQALGLDPNDVEQVILDPQMMRLILTVRDDAGERIGQNYTTFRIGDRDG